MPNPALKPDRPEYYVQTGSMFENPHGVPHDEIVQMLLEMPSEMAAQVIFGKYVESSGLVFSGELVQMLLDRTGKYYGDFTRDAPPSSMKRVTGDNWTHGPALEMAAQMNHEQKMRIYATGIDWARLNDYTVIFTIDTRSRPARVVHFRRLNRVPWEGIYREVGRVVSAFGPNVLSDGTGMAGDVILESLEDRDYCPVHDRTIIHGTPPCIDSYGNPLGGCGRKDYLSLSCVEGYNFTKQSKQNLIENLRNAMASGYRAGSGEDFGLVRCPPIVALEEELAFYSWDDKKLDTDCVMALALAVLHGMDIPGEAHIGSPFGI